jgi:hypothetical protein
MPAECRLLLHELGTDQWVSAGLVAFHHRDGDRQVGRPEPDTE